MLRPASMAELKQYSTTLEPRLRTLFEHEWMPLVETPVPGGPPRRTVLALQSPRQPTQEGAEPFLFDAPTALFTVIDFYDALNRRREQQGKEPLGPETVTSHQNGQMHSAGCTIPCRTCPRRSWRHATRCRW